MDMCFEQTANHRCSLIYSSYHLPAEIVRSCEDIAGRTTRQRKDLDATHAKKDEEDIQRIVATTETTVHPFLKDTRVSLLDLQIRCSQASCKVFVSRQEKREEEATMWIVSNI